MAFRRSHWESLCLELPCSTFCIFGHLLGIPTLSEKLENLPGLNQVVVPNFAQSSLGQVAFGRVDEPRLFKINL